MASTAKFENCTFEVKRISQNIGSKENNRKLNNIELALKKINGVLLKPNEVFSFWHFVDFPSIKNGYVKSRAIQNNTVLEEVGGGICQLSGLLYYLALHCNLQIIERHNHSIDIYKEEERFTPLGSDATVFFGYKDLVFRNNQSVNLLFKFELTENELIGMVYSDKEFTTFNLDFITQNYTNTKHVTTFVTKNNHQIMNYESVYKHKE